MFSSGVRCKVITGVLAETSKYGPSTFLRMCSLLLKERTFVFLFKMVLQTDLKKTMSVF